MHTHMRIHKHREKISLFKELSDLFTADDNHQMSRVLLNRVHRLLARMAYVL